MADFLLDTNVMLDYGVNLYEIVNSDDRLFITDIILKELDGHKKSGDENIKYQVREIFRNLSPVDSVDFKPKSGDTAAGFDFGKYRLISISREKYHVLDRADLDAKIIEMAKDYTLVLLTADRAMTVRAHGEGVKFELLTREKQAQANTDANERLESGESESCDLDWLDWDISSEIDLYL